MLGFEDLLLKQLSDLSFNTSRYLQQFRQRRNISKIKADAHGASFYVESGSLNTIKYADYGIAYIAAISLTDEIVVTLYDISTMELLICRAQQIDSKVLESLRKFVALRPNANIEARLIGMQNSDQLALAGFIALLKKHSISLVEVDLFGDQIRHVAVELRTGTSLNVLMENRLYKPGELRNTAPKAEKPLEQLIQAQIASQQQPAAAKDQPLPQQQLKPSSS